MNLEQVKVVNDIFLQLFGIVQPGDQSSMLHYNNEKLGLIEFTDQLINEGNKIGLLYLNHSLTEEEFKELLSGCVPILVFLSEEEKALPAVLMQQKKQVKLYRLKDTDQIEELVDPSSVLPRLVSHSGKIVVLSCIPRYQVDTQDEVPSTSAVKSFLKLLSTEKKEISYIYLYAIIAGLISLSLPLGIQSIINFISSGQVTTSVVVLIAFIIVGILVSGGMQIMQLTIVEHIQQKLFAKIAFNIANRLPKVKVEAILKYYPPELINRFFDILTVQKGISNILIDLTAAALQILFGLLLLSLYHPYFIFFGIILMSVLALIIYFTGPKGLETSNKESKYKYNMAYWLEEIARTLNTFKLAGYSNLAMDKTDYYIGNYLKARQKHFNVLVIQYISFVGFKTLVTAGLLILGCILVINQEINIGQFVASEIIIILIMSAVEKVILKLEKVYDILTSSLKLEQVTTLPVERQSGFKIDLFSADKGLAVKIHDLKYRYPDDKQYALKGIDLDIFPGEKVCITGRNGSGKTTLLNVLLGLLDNYEGGITYNGISLRDLDKKSFHNLLGNNLSEEEIFHASLQENITLGRKEVTLEKMLWAIEYVGLKEYVDKLPEGLSTVIIGGNLRIPKNITYKIILARSIANHPKLLILDDFLLGIEKREKHNLVKALMTGKNKWTLLIISSDPEIMELCDHTIEVEGGKIIDTRRKT